MGFVTSFGDGEGLRWAGGIVEAHRKSRERLGLSWGYLLCLVVLENFGLNLGSEVGMYVEERNSEAESCRVGCQ